MQKILSLLRRCVEDYDMIQAGDRVAAVLRNLESKGLVSLDYHLPLSNFDYSAYAPWPLHGSAALTAAGQEALDSLEVQGIEE